MIVKIRYVKKANAWAVIKNTQDVKTQKITTKIEWFLTEEEANAFKEKES